jgi:hypothetical protein
MVFINLSSHGLQKTLLKVILKVVAVFKVWFFPAEELFRHFNLKMIVSSFVNTHLGENNLGNPPSFKSLANGKM